MADIEKIFNCLEPEYVENFKCNGQLCNARCCRGFQVDIDRQTHMKYRTIKNQPLRTKILDSLYWNGDSQTYRMNLNNDSTCPMLCDDSLCLIQKNFGENFLSDICAEFPRRVYVVGDFAMRSMSLTCPIATKFALFNSEPMRFKNISLHTTRAGCFFYRGINDVPQRIFLKTLQRFGINILQNRNFSINERIFILGIMMSMIDAHGDLNLEILQEFEENFQSEEFFEKMKLNMEILEFKPSLYLETMFTLTEAIFIKAVNYYSEEQRNFVQYVPQAFDMVEKSSQPTKKLLEMYEENFSAYDEFVRKKYPNFLENYLVHNFFSGLYPCRIPGGNLTLNYFVFMTLYKVFEFGLICMAGVLKENLTIEDILEYVGRFSHRIDHGTKFQDVVIDFLCKVLEYPTEYFSSMIDFEN